MTRFFSLLLMGMAFAACDSKERADLLLYNGKMYTVDSDFSTVEAMAIHNGRIVALGNSRELKARYRFNRSEDLKQQFVYPGFNDAHCHFVYYGLNLQQANLLGCDSWHEVIYRLLAFAQNQPEGWLIGRGWDQNRWPDAAYPDRALLDSLFPNRPVLLRRVDGHAVIANALALEAAGINKTTAISGGEILRRADGSLTGVLIDNAADLARKAEPATTAAGWRAAIQDAQSACFAVGLTAVHDAGLSRLQLEVLRQMEAEGELEMRVYGMISAHPEELKYFLSQAPYKGERLHIRSFKFYADGALGSRGARLKEAYHDRHDHFGLWVTEPETLAYYAPLLAAAAYQMNTHCIGDAANQQVPQIYRDVVGHQPDHRWRIEHAQVVSPVDLAIYRDAGIVPSVQPTHATSDMYWAEERLGPERIAHAYAYQQLLQLNGWLPLGTDFPVEDISPLKTFYAAVFRTDSSGFPQGGFQFANALTREQALRGMTIWAARAAFEEQERGSFELGKKADLVVMDTDLMLANPAQIQNARLMKTMVEGKQVYPISQAK
ncbi:MAG: amidohydrolase [Bacteroidia bacterium]